MSWQKNMDTFLYREENVETSLYREKKTILCPGSKMWIHSHVRRNVETSLCRDASTTLKEIISQTDKYLVKLSSKMYVFEDKMTKY